MRERERQSASAGDKRSMEDTAGHPPAPTSTFRQFVEDLRGAARASNFTHVACISDLEQYVTSVASLCRAEHLTIRIHRMRGVSLEGVTRGEAHVVPGQRGHLDIFLDVTVVADPNAARSVERFFSWLLVSDILADMRVHAPLLRWTLDPKIPKIGPEIRQLLGCHVSWTLQGSSLSSFVFGVEDVQQSGERVRSFLTSLPSDASQVGSRILVPGKLALMIPPLESGVIVSAPLQMFRCAPDYDFLTHMLRQEAMWLLAPTVGMTWFWPQNAEAAWFHPQYAEAAWSYPQYAEAAWFHPQHAEAAWFHPQHADEALLRAQHKTTRAYVRRKEDQRYTFRDTVENLLFHKDAMQPLLTHLAQKAAGKRWLHIVDGSNLGFLELHDFLRRSGEHFTIRIFRTYNRCLSRPDVDIGSLITPPDTLDIFIECFRLHKAGAHCLDNGVERPLKSCEVDDMFFMTLFAFLRRMFAHACILGWTEDAGLPSSFAALVRGSDFPSARSVHVRHADFSLECTLKPEFLRLGQLELQRAHLERQELETAPLLPKGRGEVMRTVINARSFVDRSTSPIDSKSSLPDRVEKRQTVWKKQHRYVLLPRTTVQARAPVVAETTL